MVLNSKGQVTIPAHLRAKYGLHAGDEVEVVETGGTLQIVRTEGAESRGQRPVRRLRNTATGRDIAGMSTDQIMALLRAELTPRRIRPATLGRFLRAARCHHR